MPYLASDVFPNWLCEYNPSPEDLKYLVCLGSLTCHFNSLDQILTLLWLMINLDFQILLKYSEFRQVNLKKTKCTLQLLSLFSNIWRLPSFSINVPFITYLSLLSFVPHKPHFASCPFLLIMHIFKIIILLTPILFFVPFLLKFQ